MLKLTAASTISPLYCVQNNTKWFLRRLSTVVEPILKQQPSVVPPTTSNIPISKQQIYGMPPTTMTSAYHTLFFSEPILLAYYYQIRQCIVQYGNKSKLEARALVDSSSLFSNIKGEDAIGIFCHEPPYFWAMKILHEAEEGWKDKYWPPPTDEIECEEWSYYTSPGGDNPEVMFALQVEKNNRRMETDSHYHGCSVASGVNLAQKGISLKKGRINLDFNPAGVKGFYTTGILSQARDWALQYNSRDHAAILQYSVPVAKIDQFKVKRFRSNEYKGWHDFVAASRAGTSKHTYDVVEGPYVANPRQFTQGAAPVPRGHQLAIFSQLVADIFSMSLSHIYIGKDF